MSPLDTPAQRLQEIRWRRTSLPIDNGPSTSAQSDEALVVRKHSKVNGLKVAAMRSLVLACRLYRGLRFSSLGVTYEVDALVAYRLPMDSLHADS